ncbi:MAG: hypothetical protein ACKOHK_02625 [Planctomycetia bacterium]
MQKRVCIEHVKEVAAARAGGVVRLGRRQPLGNGVIVQKVPATKSG